MRFEVTIVAILLLAVLSTIRSEDTEFVTSLQTFSRELFSQLVKSHGQESIIYSPFSIQTCIAMARMGANGQTAEEMDQGLGFTGQTPESIADSYYSILAKYEKSDILTIANKVYVMKGCELHDYYSDLLSKKFFSSAENIDFSQSDEAANALNTWVQTKTDNKIKQLVSPSDVNSQTRLLLLNAVHFNGKWKTRFQKNKTSERDFFTDETNSVKVEMMFRDSGCEVHYTDDLNAAVLRLPYQDSDLAMLVILPSSRTGLPEVENQLKNFQFSSLGDSRYKSNCIVRLPKFNTEFELDLSDTLKDMGMNDMFSSRADLSKMLKSSPGLYVSKVVHKAVIEVSEEGTKADAATALHTHWKSLPRPPLSFEANHPFVYAIVNGDNVPIFQGVVVQP